MPRRRSSSTEFVRRCEAAETPIYLVDATGAFTFGNAALGDWLGVDLESLRGTPCRREAADDEARRIGAGLAPPPDAARGTASVGLATRPDGAQRNAWFLPLARPGVDAAVLVVLPPGDGIAAAENPWDAEALHAVVARERSAAVARPPLVLLGESSIAADLRRRVAAAAAQRETVWISGPPGIGRSRVARYLLLSGGEPIGVLAPLAVPLLSADLIAATIDAACRFAASTPRGGRPAILLRGVESATAALEPLLLDLLADSPPQVGVVATSDFTPEEAMSRPEAPVELFRRLSTLPLALPPLAARQEDLAVLAQAALEECNAAGAQRSGFHAEALDLLVHHPWPDQVAELENVVAAAHAAASGPLVAVDDLPLAVRQSREAVLHPRPSHERVDLEAVLADAERKLIERALSVARGNKTEAARLLCLTRPRLYRRMEALGLLDGDESGESGNEGNDA